MESMRFCGAAIGKAPSEGRGKPDQRQHNIPGDIAAPQFLMLSNLGRGTSEMDCRFADPRDQRAERVGREPPLLTGEHKEMWGGLTAARWKTVGSEQTMIGGRELPAPDLSGELLALRNLCSPE
jgi:hypothetical protein